MTAVRRNGFPEDIAGVILMLTSDLTQFITGVYLSVGGGVQMI